MGLPRLDCSRSQSEPEPGASRAPGCGGAPGRCTRVRAGHRCPLSRVPEEPRMEARLTGLGQDSGSPRGRSSAQGWAQGSAITTLDLGAGQGVVPGKGLEPQVGASCPELQL